MTSTALKRRDFDKTRGALCKRPGVYFKIGKFDPAFNRGTAFNRENTVMYRKPKWRLFALKSVREIWIRVQICRGTSSQYSPDSRRPCGIPEPVYHVLFINL